MISAGGFREHTNPGSYYVTQPHSIRDGIDKRVPIFPVALVMARKETKRRETNKKATKAPGRSRIKASPGGETFYVVRRKNGTFKDWVKINRSIAQDALRKAKNVPKRSGRGHQGDYPRRKKTRKKK